MKVSDWYRNLSSLGEEQQASAIAEWTLRIKYPENYDPLAIAAYALLPWEKHTTLVRITAIRCIWSLTAQPENREPFMNLRARIYYSFMTEVDEDYARRRLRGLMGPNWYSPLFWPKTPMNEEQGKS